MAYSLQLHGTRQLVVLVLLFPMLAGCCSYVSRDPGVALVRIGGRTAEFSAFVSEIDDTLQFRIRDGETVRDVGTRFRTGQDYTFAGTDGTLVLLWGGIRGGSWEGMAYADIATWAWRTIGHDALPKGFIPLCLYHSEDGELHMVGAAWGETGCEARFYDVAVRRGHCVLIAAASLGAGLSRAWYEVKATACGVGVVLIAKHADGTSFVTYQRFRSGQWHDKFILPVAGGDAFNREWAWDVLPDGSGTYVLHSSMGEDFSASISFLSYYHNGKGLVIAEYLGVPRVGNWNVRSVGRMEVDADGICHISVVRSRSHAFFWHITVCADTVFYGLMPSGPVIDKTFTVPLREGAFQHMREGLSVYCDMGDAPVAKVPWPSRHHE